MMRAPKKSYNAAPPKTLLIATFVFGYDYQGYIPFQFYSLYKHYPDYDAIVYVDRKLRKETLKLLKLIPGYGEKYRVCLVDKIAQTLPRPVMKAYRWLMYDDVFENYQYVYIGDIDIYICKEDVPLHEQHILHMTAQKSVFSNIVRAYSEPPLPKWICKHQKVLKQLGLFIPITKLHKLYNKFFYHKRITGLHFVNTRDYYPAIKKQADKFFNVYYKNHIINKIYKLIMKYYASYSDETFLYHLIKKSRLRLPKQADDKTEILFCSDMRSHNFRPHHGLHFGMWRDKTKADASYHKYMHTPLCRNYYSQFKNELEQDPILKEIMQNSPKKIQTIIYTMLDDFENC
ncbi:MAG: hypothetical protein HDR21_03645 [Lachnospiraceae bacterium]|nr:hypothetical protein [Lachnospiraceae bacterium]MBD5482505.1 hypothetical protein [Lachnospiraceae bacterium]